MAEDDDGRVVGMASYGVDADALVLWKLYVLPEQHGTGVGSALLDAVVEAAAGLAHLACKTGARGFYESRGFRVTGTEPDQLGGPDNVWMELVLT